MTLNELNIQNKESGDTFLHDSIKNNNIEIASALIKRGVNIHLENHTGQTALYYAIIYCKFTITDQLLKKGAQLADKAYLLMLQSLKNHPFKDEILNYLELSKYPAMSEKCYDLTKTSNFLWSPTMLEKTIAEKYYAALVEKDIATAKQYIDDQIQFISPLATITGKETFLGAIQRFIDSFDTLVIRHSCAKDDKTMFAYNVHFKQPLTLLHAAGLVTEKDGLITKIELFYDTKPFEALNFLKKD